MKRRIVHCRPDPGSLVPPLDPVGPRVTPVSRCRSGGGTAKLHRRSLVLTTSAASPRLWVPLLLALGTAAVYAPVRHHAFVDYDDFVYVVDNPHVNGGLTADGVGWAFTARWAANWHPLTWLSHMADVQAFGLSPGAHHLVNVGIHVANTVLLLLVLDSLTGRLWPSAFV